VIARQSVELSAHGLQGEEESAIHDRDSNIGSGTSLLKAELFTLQKTGTFHLALTGRRYRLRPAIAPIYNITKTVFAAISRVQYPRFGVPSGKIRSNLS
jgi:hypothetical protein